MFGNDAEALKQTKVTQPAIFMHSVILAKALQKNSNLILLQDIHWRILSTCRRRLFII